MTPGTAVKNLRKLKGVSQMTMAYDLGFATSGSISKIEDQAAPFTKELTQVLATYFKVNESAFEPATGTNLCKVTDLSSPVAGAL